MAHTHKVNPVTGVEGQYEVSLNHSNSNGSHDNWGGWFWTNDYAKGGGGNDTLRGGWGDDWLEGGTGADVIYGNEDKDVLFGNSGNDTLVGYDGDGEAKDYLFGGDHRDVLKGDRLDHLDGGNGNDTLWGGGKAYGGDGDDRFMNPLGLADGGDGTDTVDLSRFEYGSVHPVDAQGNTIGQTIDLNNANKFRSVENVVGSRFNDTIRGNGEANVIDGGRGNDTITGGGGADTFVIGANSGRDTITDFSINGGDRIDLRAIGIDSYAEFRAAATNVNGNVVVDLGNGNQLTLNGVTEQAFTGNDFIF